MPKIKSRKPLLAEQEYEPPEKKIISEGDLFIKTLYEKQTCTETTLHEQMCFEKQFEKSTELIPMISDNIGIRKSEQIEALQTQLEDLGKSKAIEDLLQRHKMLTRECVIAKLQKIEKLLQSRIEKKTADTEHKVEIKRHLKECLAVKPESVETKLLKFGLENENYQKNYNFEHPMNEIKDLEKTLMDSVSETTDNCSVKKFRKRVRNLTNQLRKLDEEMVFKTVEPLAITSQPQRKSASKWDIKEKVEVKTKHFNGEKKVYSCKPQNYYTIIDGKIVPINKDKCKDNDSVESLIESPKNRLTVEEIKKIPHFQSYQSGNKSKVLYLKNLANGVSENDLREVFKQFEVNIISIKVMKGKMKGQAFIEFKNEDVAENALEQVNGIFLRNKPIIIHFGKGCQNK